MVRKLTAILLFVLLPIFTYGQEAELRVDPEVGSIDDTFRLRVTLSGLLQAHPTLKGGDDFQISFVGPQRSIKIINGSFSQETIYVYNLRPKKTGNLESPSAVVKTKDGFKTLAARKITVNKRSGKQTSEELVKLTRWINSPEIFLGEQLLSTLTLYQRVDIHDSQLAEGDYDGFWVEHVGSKKRFAARLAGRQAEATAFTRVLFPLRTGTLIVQPSAVQGKMTLTKRSHQRNPFGFKLGVDPFDEIFGRVEVKQVTVKSEEYTIKVKPLPKAPKDIPNLDTLNPIVGKTRVEVSYDAGPVDYGEGKTILYKVKSTGNLNPLQKLPFKESNQFKIYEENPYITHEIQGDKVEFTKHFPVTVMPLRGGVVKIPSLKLSYFDPESESYETLVSRQVELSVLGGFQTKIEEAPLPKIDKVEAKDSDQPLLLWEEQGYFEKLLSNSHPLSSIFYGFLLALLVLLASGIVKVIKFKQRTSTVSKKLSRAEDYIELKRTFDQILQKFFNTGESFTRDDLKAALNHNNIPSETALNIILIYDQLCSAEKAPANTDSSFVKLKSDAVKALNAVPQKSMI